MKAEQEQACEESGMYELRNASSQNSNSFLERFDRMNPWRRRRNFKSMKLQNSLVGTKAFIKDSLRQCARLVKAFGTKLSKSQISAKLVKEFGSYEHLKFRPTYRLKYRL